MSREELEKRIQELEAENTRLSESAFFRDLQADNNLVNFKLLVENAPEPIFIQVDVKFAYVNKAAINLYGATSADQLLGRYVTDFVYPDFLDIVKQRIQLLNQNQLAVSSAEYKHLKIDGTAIDVEVSAVPITYNQKTGALVFIKDITERKKYEDEIKQRTEELQNFFDCAIDMLCIANTDGYFLRMNKEWENVLGYSLQDLENSSFLDLVHPDDLQATLEAINHLKGQINLTNFINRYRCKNGEYRWLEWRSTPVGNLIYASARDITSQKEIQDALVQKNIELEESEEEIRATNEELMSTTKALKENFAELQRAKEILEENESNLLEAQRISRTGNWYIDISTNQMEWSKACFWLFEIDETTINPENLQAEFRKHVIAEDLERINNLEAEAIQKQEGISYEFRANINNTIRSFQIIAEPVFDASRTLVAFKGTIQDITDRKQFEDKLQKSYDLLNNLAAQVPGVLYQFRLYPDGRSAFPYSSPGMYDIYEVTSEEVREDGTPIFYRIHPDDREYISESIIESVSNQTIFHGDFRVILPKQGLRWRHCDAKPHLLEDGSTLWHGIILDITDRMLAEEKIKEQQSLFETVFNTITDGVVITDKERRITLANKGVQNIFGYAPGELIGKSTNVLYAGDEFFNKAGKEIFNEHSLNSDNFYFTRYVDKKGIEFPGETFGAKLYNANGEWIGNLAVMRNVSERLKYIEDLKVARENAEKSEEMKSQLLSKAEESDRLKTAFLNNISHEIRTPMNGIIGFSGFLNDPDLSPQKRAHFTDMIIQSSNQLLSVITDIISIATIEAGQEKIFEMEIKLNTIVKFLFAHFAETAEKKNVAFRFETSLTDNDDKIITDKAKLEGILTNLVGNALKFTEQGHVTFGYSIKDPYIEFFIEDTGIGIASEMHSEIFKRFRQVEIYANRKFGGSGLGLSISKAYTELLGGKIWLTSELGKGSTFFFTIPYKKMAPFNPPTPITESRRSPDKPITLLIAEDEDSNFILLTEMLAEENLVIIRAKTGLEAVHIAKTNPDINIILMDIKMPEMDGLEATRQIKAFRPYLPIVAQTAYSFPEEKNQAFMAGCDMFLPKPIRKEELIYSISQVTKEI